MEFANSLGASGCNFFLKLNTKHMLTEIFTMADFASVEINGKINVIGTFDLVGAHAVPVTHPHCAIALRFRLANKEAGQHSFEIIGKTPDGKVFIQNKQHGYFSENPQTDYITINCVMPMVGLKFDKFGKYVFEFYFDDEFQSGLSLHVINVPLNISKAA